MAVEADFLAMEFARRVIVSQATPLPAKPARAGGQRLNARRPGRFGTSTTTKGWFRGNQGMLSRRSRAAVWLCVVILLTATTANAAAEKPAHPSEFIFLVQVLLLITVGRGLGEIMQRIGQPSVIGE